MSNLKSKTAFVTGGSRGIGAAIVRRLVQGGAAVCFTYVNSASKADELAAELTKQGGNILALQADSTDATRLTAAINQAAAAFGHIDILINSAGISLSKPIEEHSLADLQKLLAVHVEAPFVATQAVLPHMPAGGRIISIGSCLGDRVPNTNATLYATSKSALQGFTQGLARDLGPRRITVNLIQPGPVDTDLSPADGPGSDVLRSKMAIPEFGQPEDIASLVAWVTKPESRFMTGSTLTIDGGLNA